MHVAGASDSMLCSGYYVCLALCGLTVLIVVILGVSIGRGIWPSLWTIPLPLKEHIGRTYQSR
jgi:hypothetical protein